MTRRIKPKGVSDAGDQQVASARHLTESPATPDARLMALVKFLARRAAELDYAEHRNRLQSANPASGIIGASQ